jgi:hypothetical protein
MWYLWEEVVGKMEKKFEAVGDFELEFFLSSFSADWKNCLAWCGTVPAQKRLSP